MTVFKNDLLWFWRNILEMKKISYLLQIVCMLDHLLPFMDAILCIILDVLYFPYYLWRCKKVVFLELIGNDEKNVLKISFSEIPFNENIAVLCSSYSSLQFLRCFLTIFLLPKILIYLNFQSFEFDLYLMIVNPETCTAILPASFFDGDSSNLYEIFISRISPLS